MLAAAIALSELNPCFLSLFAPRKSIFACTSRCSASAKLACLSSTEISHSTVPALTKSPLSTGRDTIFPVVSVLVTTVLLFCVFPLTVEYRVISLATELLTFTLVGKRSAATSASRTFRSAMDGSIGLFSLKSRPEPNQAVIATAIPTDHI